MVSGRCFLGQTEGHQQHEVLRADQEFRPLAVREVVFMPLWVLKGS